MRYEYAGVAYEGHGEMPAAKRRHCSSSCSWAWATRLLPAPSASPRELVRSGATAGRAARVVMSPRAESGWGNHVDWLL